MDDRKPNKYSSIDRVLYCGCHITNKQFLHYLCRESRKQYKYNVALNKWSLQFYSLSFIIYMKIEERIIGQTSFLEISYMNIK